ncbi:hypothetical protein NQ314_012916 [Rhamnusium bicolor]|uniref:Uncharacterized protein n=1 Tax=Rhamnusium bicolor TaxID=1586634 RepID=A0AAV8X9G1_9CUCU|nr:hypothetical protein NQ314_012916 [Rhamnusium bicolor]
MRFTPSCFNPFKEPHNKNTKNLCKFPDQDLWKFPAADETSMLCVRCRFRVREYILPEPQEEDIILSQVSVENLSISAEISTPENSITTTASNFSDDLCNYNDHSLEQLYSEKKYRVKKLDESYVALDNKFRSQFRILPESTYSKISQDHSLMIAKVKELFNAETDTEKNTENFNHVKSPGNQPLNLDIKKLVIDFYENEENSKQLAGMKDFKSVKNCDGDRIRVQKKLILCNLKELYQNFKTQYDSVPIRFSKFASLRPAHCILAGSSGTHVVCVCTIHQNVKLMLEGCNFPKFTKNSHWIDESQPVYKNLLNKLVCANPTEFIKSSLPGMLGQMARFYTPLLLTNIAAVVLMTLKCQLRSLKNGHCSIFFVAVKEGAKPYYVLTIAKLLAKIFSGEKWINLFPKPDVLFLIEDRTDFFLLPLLLYLCSVGIVWLLAVIFSISLITLESTVHRLVLTFLARTVSFTINWSDYLMSVFHKVPFIVAGFLIFLCLSTCGSLALCVGAVFYFLKLTQMSHDYIEEVVWFIVKKFAKRCKQALSKKKTASKEKSQEKCMDDVAENITDLETNLNEEQNEDVENDMPENVGRKQIEENSLFNEVDSSNNIDNNEDQIETEKNDSVDAIKLEKEQNDDKEYEDEANQTITQSNQQAKREEKDQHEEQSENNEEKPKKSENELSNSYNSIFFHSTLFFIWCIITVINIPAVLTWAHNFK